MTLARLSDVLAPCLTDGTAVAGLVVLGWEDALAYVRAAEVERRPVILQAGPGCRAHTPLPVLGAMFRTLADGASVPVVAHLDHGESGAVCAQAIDCGFTSVMYDGSALPLEANIAATADIVALAHRHGVSVEAELGFVGYHGGAASHGHRPGRGCAVRDGNRGRCAGRGGGQQPSDARPGGRGGFARLQAIQLAAPRLPLVLHGGSGLAHAVRRRLAQETTVCKFNIGTELRMAFGAALRDVLARDPEIFDRVRILGATVDPMIAAARQAIRSVAPGPV